MFSQEYGPPHPDDGKDAHILQELDNEFEDLIDNDVPSAISVPNADPADKPTENLILKHKDTGEIVDMTQYQFYLADSGEPTNQVALVDADDDEEIPDDAMVVSTPVCTPHPTPKRTPMNLDQHDSQLPGPSHEDRFVPEKRPPPQPKSSGQGTAKKITRDRTSRKSIPLDDILTQLEEDDDEDNETATPTTTTTDASPIVKVPPPKKNKILF